MSDSEDADFFVESWALPQTAKGKNALKEGKKHQTLKSRTTKTDERVREEKKSLTFKKAMMERKEKKKEKSKEKKKGKKKGKKRKKHKLALELGDHFAFTQAGGATLKEKTAAVKKEKPRTDNLGQESVKKTKRKKIVAFGLSPTYIRVKRPKFASSSPKEMEAAGDGVQVTVTGRGQLHPYDNDSQCSGEDHSQDLFITQKTFRASPPEPSSGEASQRAEASLQAFTQPDKDPRRASGEVKRRPGESGKMETQVSHIGDRKVCAHAEPEAVASYADEPVFANHIPAAVSSKHCSLCPPFINESAPFSPCSRSTSTQTENFFTAELSSYTSFKSRVTVDLQNLRPLDLSLPHRVRKDLCLSLKMSLMDGNVDIEELLDRETSLLPGEIQNTADVSSSDIGHTDTKNESSGQVEATLSPRSEADPRSADTTASSEDDHPCRTGKRDLIQVRAVQTRLNKPFFFKTKGEGQSPRPESPLMKLSQGRDVKAKKRH